uniref:Centromere protein H n=2 Tax=Anser cygnoides TaxID=8845 RepID=A0A8B9DG82_ANSCY|nr:centromere protein H [Anser cygnoides]
MRPMQNLEGALEEIKISFENKTLCMQRMQLVDALRNKMTQNDDDERRLIVETMEHTVKLSKAILESQQQTREIEEKLNDIRKKRLILKQAEEDKLLQIRDVKKKKEVANMKVAEILESVHKNLQTERAMATVIQNVFQNIIIGSRVNWAEDPSLKAIVLQLEKSIFI